MYDVLLRYQDMGLCAKDLDPLVMDRFVERPYDKPKHEQKSMKPRYFRACRQCPYRSVPEEAQSAGGF